LDDFAGAYAEDRLDEAFGIDRRAVNLDVPDAVDPPLFDVDGHLEAAILATDDRHAGADRSRLFDDRRAELHVQVAVVVVVETNVLEVHPKFLEIVDVL